MKCLSLALSLCALCVHARVQAQAADPQLVWHTIHTEHFDTTYHDPLGPLAQRLAVAAEHAHVILSRSLGYQASERTLILLSDDSDDANGLAGAVPRNEIRLFASSPDDLSAISDYDDWVSTLVTHEHTHVLHLDQVGGIPAIINAILGKTVSPNGVQPRWFIEGLATYEESAQSSGGRMRSTLFDMMLRMDVLQDRWPSIAQLSNDYTRWPYGDIRYLYGSRFLAFIAERHGPEALSRMGTEYGRQALPFGLNRIAKRATGKTFIELYDELHASLVEHYRTQRERVIAAGEVEGEPISVHEDLTRAPRFLPDGRLVYYANDGHVEGGLRLLGGRALTRTVGEAALAPHPDGTRVIYSQVAPHRDVYSYDDLFELELETGRSKRLTDGMRAREPDVAPNGREIAFITQKNGTSQLEVAQLDDIADTRRVLMSSGPQEQAFTPRYSPDGRRIVLSVWRTGGYRDIVMVDRQSGAIQTLTHDRALDTGPSWSPDGRRVYFSSDRSGIANIYAFELGTGVLYQITNVIAGAYQPVISPDGKRLIYVGYRSEGFGLRRLVLDAQTERLAEAYVDTRPAPTLLPPSAALPVSDYEPTQTLLPSNYRLELNDSVLGAALSVHVRGNDIAGFHNYALRATIDFDEAVPSVAVRYAYARTPLTPYVRVFRDLYGRSDLVVGAQKRRWIAENVGVDTGVSYRFPALFSAQVIDFSYSLVHVDKLHPFGGRLDPNDPPPIIPELGFIPSAGFGYRYSDVSRVIYDISPSSGRNLGLHVDLTDPIMGRDIQSVALRLQARQFLAMPWLRHHVLALHYSGGFAGGDRGRVGVFNLGGFPEDAAFPSLYDLAVFGTLPTLGGEALRGYPQGFRSGTQYHLVQLEYRFPLFAPEWGPYTLPYYLRRLFAGVFSDIGDAFSDPVELSDFVVSAGAELFTTIELTYRVDMTLRLGVAHGFSEGGETQYYLHLGTPF